MKTTIDKEFFEKWKDKEVAMWCKKEEYAKEFCRLMYENGLEWRGGSSYLDGNCWENHEEATVYYFNDGTYCDLKWCAKEQYTILDFEDYIVKEKMTKKELVELIIENFTSVSGDIDISGLDFTNFNGDVDIDRMKANCNIYQSMHKTSGSIFQNDHVIKGNIYQDSQNAENITQQNQKANKVYQDEEKTTDVNNNLLEHYNISEVDTMDLILTICEHNNTDVRESFYLANTLKYLIRYKNKNGIEYLNKAKDYLDRLINEISKQGE